ncbi:MAG: DUF2911 domain-containing protein [Acidobacteriia bacterium]|nr:DUF2911 domain-containing protein [Terriglobia bacterium]
MKRLLSMLGVTALLFCLAAIAYAQGQARGAAKLELKGQTVSVDYGQPALNGRTVQQLIGQLKPGDVWRLGSNKSTTFSTGTDLVFGDVTVPKGEYSLWARKEADGGWKLVFNKQHGQWGTQHDAAQDLAAAPLTETKASKSAEQVTISLEKAGDGGTITIQWGDMLLSANFAAK